MELKASHVLWIVTFVELMLTGVVEFLKHFASTQLKFTLKKNGIEYDFFPATGFKSEHHYDPKLEKPFTQQKIYREYLESERDNEIANIKNYKKLVLLASKLYPILIAVLVADLVALITLHLQGK